MQIASIGYHSKAKDLNISSLAFADDLIIFYDGKPSSLHIITSTLDDFKLVYGLEMNRDKTRIYIVGLNIIENEETTAFGYANGTFSFRCLRLTTRYILISSQPCSMATKTLSFAGRL